MSISYVNNKKLYDCSDCLYSVILFSERWCVIKQKPINKCKNMFFSLNVVHQIDSFCVPKGILYKSSRRRGRKIGLLFVGEGIKQNRQV